MIIPRLIFNIPSFAFGLLGIVFTSITVISDKISMILYKIAISCCTFTDVRRKLEGVIAGVEGSSEEGTQVTGQIMMRTFENSEGSKVSVFFSKENGVVMQRDGSQDLSITELTEDLKGQGWAVVDTEAVKYDA